MESYDDPQNLPSEMESPLAKGLTALRIHAEVTGSRKGDNKWRMEEHTRVKEEIAAIDKILKNWDPEEVAAQAKKSIIAEQAVKRARLMECEAQMDLDGIKYESDSSDGPEDGDVVEEGNPWNIQKRGEKFVVVKSIGPNKGRVMGRHDTKAKAQAQRRALYANIEE